MWGISMISVEELSNQLVWLRIDFYRSCVQEGGNREFSKIPIILVYLRRQEP